MNIKQESISSIEIAIKKENNNVPSKRVRKQSQKFAGELQGMDMERAVDKALNNLENQKFKKSKSEITKFHSQSVDSFKPGKVIKPENIPLKNASSQQSNINQDILSKYAPKTIEHFANVSKSLSNRPFTVICNTDGTPYVEDSSKEMHFSRNEFSNQLKLSSKIAIQPSRQTYPKIANIRQESSIQQTLIMPEQGNIANVKKEIRPLLNNKSVKKKLSKQNVINTGTLNSSKSPYSFKGTRIENLPISKTSTGGRCDVCSREFSKMDNCRRHFMQVHGELYRPKDILCLVCKDAFAFERNLSAHMKKVHNISGRIEMVKEFNGLCAKTTCGKGVCLVCAKVISQMKNMQRHLKQHFNQSQIGSIGNKSTVRKDNFPRDFENVQESNSNGIKLEKSYENENTYNFDRELLSNGNIKEENLNNDQIEKDDSTEINVKSESF